MQKAPPGVFCALETGFQIVSQTSAGDFFCLVDGDCSHCAGHYGQEHSEWNRRCCHAAFGGLDASLSGTTLASMVLRGYGAKHTGKEAAWQLRICHVGRCPVLDSGTATWRFSRCVLEPAGPGRLVTSTGGGA